MFYSPDVSYSGNDWTNNPVLYVGTGDRQHARYTMISNRMYYVSDTGETADETDLLNLTCDELETDATVDTETKVALKNILYGGPREAFTGFLMRWEPVLTLLILSLSTPASLRVSTS